MFPVSVSPVSASRVSMFRAFACLVFLLLALTGTASGGARPGLEALLSDIPGDRIESGILYDRVLPLSGIEAYDGGPEAEAVSAETWRQIYFEIRHASLVEPDWPDLDAFLARSRPEAEGAVPLAVLDFTLDRLQSDALETGALAPQGGRLVLERGDPFVTRRVLSAAPLRGWTYHGDRVSFRLDRRDYLTNSGTLPSRLEIDFDDGRGFTEGGFDRLLAAHYTESGTKTIRLRLHWSDGGEGEAPATLRTGWASFEFEVRSLRAPAPSDTLPITATIPYLGQFGTGQAFVYLAPNHTSLMNPAVVLEGFDLDNSMGWDELYDLLNREQLLETLRTYGFDAVVLNFTDATDYIQRHAFTTVRLLQEVQALAGPDRVIPMVGASMGGLAGRYALSYMEQNGLPHQVGTFISFDSPQTGANIPLGMQYWLAFFADDSAEAAALLAALDRPAARQLLAYHHTDPPGGTGQSDPLRVQFLAELAALGNYPVQPRLVAVANGSGHQVNQGFNAGDQVVLWEYRSFLVDVTGNIWAVPNGNLGRIFHGLVDIIFVPQDEQVVQVSGTAPYDNSPGGWRSSMAQMDAVEAPYGDIIALHDNHSFIPTTSALALDTADLFYDIAGDPNLLAHTPFDAVYFPFENQEHVSITPESAVWLLSEIRGGTTGTPGVSAELVSGMEGGPSFQTVFPNPSDSGVHIRYQLPRQGPARLALYDAAGALVSVLSDESLAAGPHEVFWNGSDAPGRRVAPGVYFLSLKGEGFSASRKILLR